VIDDNSGIKERKELGGKLLVEAIKLLNENGGEMSSKDLFNQIEKRVPLPDWSQVRYEKSGATPWKSLLRFESIGLVKGGYLIKKSGMWYLDMKGKDLANLTPEEVIKKSAAAYREWKNDQVIPDDIDPGDPDNQKILSPLMIFEEMEQFAISSLENHINKKNAYEFQDLVAALLRGMGYYTPFVAPKGKDGGVDVIAYRDPLGTESPRIRMQIKHREEKTDVKEVRQLIGILNEQDVGIFVSSNGFTSDAKIAARSSQKHIELIDLTRFIDLWKEFYKNLSEEDKNLLPLVPIYFLAQPK